MDIEEFRKMMQIPASASEEYILRSFDEIADILKNHCIILYDDKEFRVLDFEFYYFNNNHKDISVHPRNSAALCWYINDFGGIDLNFESKITRVEDSTKSIITYKYKLEDESFFGGVLIRQIQDLNTGKVYDGPLKVADLFRLLDATSCFQKNPVIQMKSLPPIEFKEPEQRHNLLGSSKDAKRKAEYNLKECFCSDIREEQKLQLAAELSGFNRRKYRYCYKKH